MSKNKNLNIIVELLYDDDNNKTGVIIKYKDFRKLMNKVEDFHDIYDIYKRKNKATKTISIEQVKKELFGTHAKK